MMHAIAILTFSVLLSSVFVSSAHAVECGDVLYSKIDFGLRPTTYYLTRDLSCSTPIGVTLANSNIVLDFNGHSIACRGTNRIGVRTGGHVLNGAVRRMQRQAIINPDIHNCTTAIQNHHSDTTLIQRTNTTSYISRNFVGIKTYDTTRATMLGLSVSGNTHGLLITHSTIPGIVNTISQSNSGIGLALIGTTSAILRNNIVSGNGWTYDTGFWGTTGAQLTAGSYGRTVFATNSFYNHWCGTIFQQLIAGPTNGASCP